MRMIGHLPALVLVSGIMGVARAQSVDVPMTAANWTFAGDSSRFEQFLGRPSLRVGRGVAIAHGVDLRNGAIDFDMAADSTAPFLGVIFHAQSADNFEDIFFRVGSSGTSEAVQYTPCLNGENIWELVHGPDANGLATIARNQWAHVKIVLAGDTATLYVGADTALINRYRRGANVTPPRDSVTGEILTDSVMDGRVAGTKVVFARSVIESDRAQFRRMHFGYANGVVVFVNGIPLFFGANPFGMRDLGGVMETTGEAVYLPLKKGHNEIVLAVTDFFAGWGFWARLDQ